MSGKAVLFKHLEAGAFDTEPEIIRYSSAVQRLRDRGASDTDLAALEADRVAAAVCPTHGALTDPLIGYADTREGPRVAFCCPWCSDPALLAAWEAEGRRGVS